MSSKKRKRPSIRRYDRIWQKLQIKGFMYPARSVRTLLTTTIKFPWFNRYGKRTSICCFPKSLSYRKNSGHLPQPISRHPFLCPESVSEKCISVNLKKVRTLNKIQEKNRGNNTFAKLQTQNVTIHAYVTSYVLTVPSDNQGLFQLEVTHLRCEVDDAFGVVS